MTLVPVLSLFLLHRRENTTTTTINPPDSQEFLPQSEIQKTFGNW